MPLLPRVGDRFGRYRIDSQIGRGGMGVVFGATDLSFNRTVALKVVSAALGDSSEFRQRFEREAAVLARLDSPHIISIFDYGVEHECPYIATQYVAGGDLGGLLRTRGPMPPALALAVCAQVADALDDAHRAGVVHRDVKPGNVLLRDADAPEPHAYLCDFGIARTTSDGLTTPGSVAGTWSYLSPECGRGAPGTPASDIYALGCLLWVTLTGTPPYRGSDIEIAVAHQQAPVPQLAGDDVATRMLNDVLALSMAKEPGDRFADADQFRLAMLAAAGAGPSTVAAVPITGPGSGVPRALSSGTGSGTGSLSGSGPLSYGSLPRALPPPPARGRRTGLVVALACVAVLVVAGGIVGITRHGGGHDTAPPTATSSDATSTATSTGSPTTTPTRVDDGGPITGDLDGDGLGDLTVAYTHSLRRHGSLTSMVDTTTWDSTGSAFEQGATTTRPSVPKGDTHPYARLVGDFDGDDRLEVLTVSQVRVPASSISIVGDLSGGTHVSSVIREPKGVTPFPAVGDVNGDGRDDIVALLYHDYDQKSSALDVSVFDGKDFGAFTSAGAVHAPYSDVHLVVGDFDGDERADIAEVHNLGTNKDLQERSRITLLMGNGTSFTAAPSTRVVETSCCGIDVTSADLDGDEDDEVVVVDPDQSHPVLALDLVDGTLGKPRVIGSIPGVNTTSTPYVVYSSDVNGDGRDDIVVVGDLTSTRGIVKVGVSDGTGITPSKWAAWSRNFETSTDTEYFEVPGNTL